MAWLSSLLKKPDTQEPEEHIDERTFVEEEPRRVPLKGGPPMAILAPDIGGISSFLLQFFPDAASAAQHVEALDPESRRGTHAFWALHDEPDLPPDAHREALVLIRANHTSDVVYVVSFTELESAWSFARFETKRGLDPSHLVIYWAAFATVREEFNGVTILPTTPPATKNMTTATLAPPPLQRSAPIVETPTESEEEAEAAFRAHAAGVQAAEAEQLAVAARQAEAEAVQIAEEARRAAVTRRAEEERAEEERAQVEAARLAEEARVEAEAASARSEALRIEAEAETARAEAARVQAEIEAVRAEVAHIEAEAARADAGRLEAERRVEAVRQVQAEARALAEASRAAEETHRAEILNAAIEGSLQVAPPPTVGTPVEPIVSFPGDDEAIEDAIPGYADEPAAAGTVFLHAPAEVQIPAHLRKANKNKRKDIVDPTAELPQTAPLDEFDIAYEVERLLTNRRWDKREEPFNGFKSPPGRF